jgi:hypothetical protein
MSGLLAGLAAVGAVGYYSARGISGPAPTSTTGSGAMSRLLQAAAAGDNGADFGFTGSCGVERHDVKDLLDGFVPGAPKDSSVTALRAIPVPAGAIGGRTPPEMDVYRIQAVATAFKIEADSDVHLAIGDPTDPNHATMIAEFPAASCLAESTAAPQMEAARADMISALGDPPTGSYRFLNPAPCVTLTGVAFFDRIHGQRGVAPNGIELHPVLAFQSGCGVPAPPPTSTATTPEEPPDTTPVTTAPLPTVSTPSVPAITTVPTTPTPVTTPTSGRGCKRYPGRHWYQHRYHRSCRSYYFSTP